MARKSISNMSGEEKTKHFGKKKKFKPLFEIPEKIEKHKKTRKNKESEDKVDSKHDKVSNSKRKKNKNVVNIDKGLDKNLKRKSKRKHDNQEETKKQRVPRIKYKTIEGEAVNEFLIEYYSKITQKKTKKEKEFDEAKRRTMVPSNIILAMHEDSGPERFNMIGKLVEKKYARLKGYATGYFLYQIYK
jgi:hypothetical protein